MGKRGTAMDVGSEVCAMDDLYDQRSNLYDESAPVVGLYMRCRAGEINGKLEESVNIYWNGILRILHFPENLTHVGVGGRLAMPKPFYQ